MHGFNLGWNWMSKSAAEMSGTKGNKAERMKQSTHPA
jgi:hypothetical protein